MDPDVRGKILDRGRAREWERWEQPQPSLKEIRAKYGENISDEEILLRFYAGKDWDKLLGKSSAPDEYRGARHPLVDLVDHLSQRRDLKHIFIQDGDLSVSLRTETPTT